MKNKTKVEELDATLVLMQKKSASDGVGVIWKRLSKLNTKVKDSGTFYLSRWAWRVVWPHHIYHRLKGKCRWAWFYRNCFWKFWMIFIIKIIQVGEEQMDQLADSLVSSTWESNKQIARMSNCLYSATSDEGSCQILPSGFFPLTHFPLGVGPSHPSKKRILFNFALHILTGTYWIWYERNMKWILTTYLPNHQRAAFHSVQTGLPSKDYRDFLFPPLYQTVSKAQRTRELSSHQKITVHKSWSD